MGVAMLLLTLWVRPRILPRLLPVLLVLPIVAHVAAPGALGGISHSFGIGGGTPLIQSVQGRAGQAGSGRLDDIDPGLELWSQSPLVGLGIGTEEVATSGVPLAAPTGGASTAAIIFDNQYLRTLVSLGLVGLIGVGWFVWGSVARLGQALQAARRRRREPAGGVCDRLRRLWGRTGVLRCVLFRPGHPDLLHRRSPRAAGPDARSEPRRRFSQESGMSDDAAAEGSKIAQGFAPRPAPPPTAGG